MTHAGFAALMAMFLLLVGAIWRLRLTG